MSALPHAWAEATIGELADYVSRGRSPRYVERSELPVINQRCVRWHGVDEAHVKFVDPATWHQWDENRYLRRNDILWNSTGTGTIGRAALFSELRSFDRAVVDSHVTIVRAGAAIEPAYLFGFIQSPAVQDKIEDMQSGSTNQVELNRSEIISTVVPVAPLPEQRRIVAQVDELTARTARARKKLDRIPALITRYKQRLLALAFSGEETSTWPEKSIGEISDFVTSGSRGWAQYYSSAGDMFVRVGNVRRADIKLDLSDVQCVKPPAGAEGRRTQLEKGDVLVTITADLGRVGVYESDETAYVNQHVALVRLENPRQARFVAWYLSSERGQSQLFENNRGATKAGLGLGDIKGVSIPVPEIDEQDQIVRRIESAFGWLDRMTADHAAAARLLPKLDAAILAKAFRGELIPQDPSDEPASVLLERIKAGREADGKMPKSGRGRKPNGSKAQTMIEKPLPPRERLMKDSETWPPVGLPFEAIAMRNSMPHDALRDALFELLSGPSPTLQQRFDTDAEVMIIQRVAA